MQFFCKACFSSSSFVVTTTMFGILVGSSCLAFSASAFHLTTTTTTTTIATGLHRSSRCSGRSRSRSIATRWYATADNNVNSEEGDDSIRTDAAAAAATTTSSSDGVGGDNSAMAFLRKIGKVGGAMDFSNTMGVDEGPAGKSREQQGTATIIRRAKDAYASIEVTGMIDDLTEPFPLTSSGTQWSGYTDQVMGGKSSGSITREVMDGKLANVLRGTVSLANNGGFVQMATDLALNPAVSKTVDMTDFDGIEVTVMYTGGDPSATQEEFNIHLKNQDCARQFSSYRGTVVLPRGAWSTVRISWSEFDGYGPGAENVSPMDVTTLRRIGIVAIGREMDVTLAVSNIKCYSVLGEQWIPPLEAAESEADAS